MAFGNEVLPFPTFNFLTREELMYSMETQLSKLVREKLDRAFHNAAWQLLLFPNAHCLTLPKFHSDHHPTIVSTNEWESHSSNKQFLFQPMWQTHPFFVNLELIVGQHMNSTCLTHMISLKTFTRKYTTFRDVLMTASHIFGHVGQNKKHIRARLLGTQRALCH